MSDLLQSQIEESCKLALPDGLKELMSDISREVLRAQPTNVYAFITSYLAALLVSRENLSVGCRICQDVCDSCCALDLEDELKNIGLDEENAAAAKWIIEKYFRKGKANEGNLILKLMRNTNISEHQLELIQGAVRNAFLQNHISNGTATPKMPQGDDSVSRAVIHTLQLYAGTGPSEEEYNQKASSIQAAYRAYGVRRLCKSKLARKKRVFDSVLKQVPPRSTECEFDISSDASQTDISKSPSVLHYDSAKFKDTDKSSSHINLAEISEAENAHPCIDYDKLREQTQLTEQSKVKYKKPPKRVNKKASIANSHDGEISSLSEINVREFNEIFSNEAIYAAEENMHEINLEHVGEDEAEIAEDVINKSDLPME